MPSVRGDNAKLQQAIFRIRQLGTQSSHLRMRQELGAKAMELVRQQFQVGADPYGKRWRKRKDSNPWPILVKSGLMRDRFAFKLLPIGFAITNSQNYYRFHQYGTRRLPARMMLPTRHNQLGSWARPFADIITRFVSNWQKRAA